jgi:hypothetical protein
VYAFTPSELTASGWLYQHAAPGSVLVLAADNFPGLEVANYRAYNLVIVPSDPQSGQAWLDEGNVLDVEEWLISLGHPTVYVVFSQSMANYASYFGYPTGYEKLAKAVARNPRWHAVYRNPDVVIYRVTTGFTG